MNKKIKYKVIHIISIIPIIILIWSKYFELTITKILMTLYIIIIIIILQMIERKKK